jgi:uroporphyrinogen decarboxylase
MLKPHSISLWRHFLDREKTVDELTTSMIAWQERWNWDYLKINPPACYHALDWGAEYEFFNDPFAEPKLRKPAILTARDIDSLVSPDPSRGVLGDQLAVIRNLRSHFGPGLPIYETVFSPIEIAHRLMSGRDAFASLRKNNPEATHKLLSQIADVFRQFCNHCIDAGADGIFFATKWATSDRMTWEEYVEFGKNYEIPIICALRLHKASIILHVCGENTYLHRMLDYDVDVFSYDFFAPGVPDATELLTISEKYILGGVDFTPGRNAADVIEQSRKYAPFDRWLPGASCVVAPELSEQAIESIVSGIRGLLPQ